MPQWPTMARDPDTAIGGGVRRFPSTRASLITGAARGDAVVRQAALSDIAAIYWQPVYRYIRLKWGKTNEDAKT
jgi:hypothetical protein